MMRDVSGEVAELADAMQRFAEKMFVGKERHTSITVFDDGDYSIKITHTFAKPDSELGEWHKEQVKYHHSEDENPYYRIIHRWAEPVSAESAEHTIQRKELTSEEMH